MTDSQTDQTDDRHLLGVSDVAAELLDDWRWLLGGLHARFATGDFATGLRLVEAIGAAAEAADHHPDIDLRYPFVQVSLRSHDVGGVTQRDVRLAREITDAAGRLGASADVASLSLLELGLDTAAHEDIRPFWAAVLGIEIGDPDDEVRDGAGLLPTVWFQAAPTATQPSDQRWHLDITVAPEIAEQRVQAALEAGGTLVSDARRPSFWVLADAQGNQACICTPLGRTETVPVDD
ncbi:MAG: VOC family protein [Nocardioides sp.]